MPTQKRYGIIPEGELTCVWMDAGVVDYKLCERKYQCEHCPFDAQTRQRLQAAGQQQAVQTPLTVEHSVSNEFTMNTYFEQKLSALLLSFSNPELPGDRMYSSNHLWFKQTGPVSFRVGINHLMLSLIKSVSGIAFVRVPAYIKPQAPCAWIEHEGSTLPLRMPLAVTIANANIRVRETPRLLKQHPYENGWLLRLKPESAPSVSETLFSASEAGALYLAQATMFRADCLSALAEKHSRVGTTLYDGGTPLETVEDIVGPTRYSKMLVHRFLLL